MRIFSDEVDFRPDFMNESRRGLKAHAAPLAQMLRNAR